MTVETKTWEVKVTEETMNALYEAYNKVCLNCIHAGFGPEGQEALDAKLALENALVDMGMLEADEEPEEEEDEDDDRNSAEHWDEWAADQRYDEYRDRVLMGYEY